MKFAQTVYDKIIISSTVYDSHRHIKHAMNVTGMPLASKVETNDAADWYCM